MARYRKVDVRIWNDAKFNNLSPMKPSGQALFLYLLTNPDTTSIPGMMRFSEAGAADALGWSIRAFRKAWREIESQNLAKADFKRRFLWLPNAIKYNKPESPNVIKGWFKHYQELPECELRDEAIRNHYEFILSLGSEFRKAFEKAFGEALPKSMPNQEQEQEQEQKKAKLDFSTGQLEGEADRASELVALAPVDWPPPNAAERGKLSQLEITDQAWTAVCEYTDRRECRSKWAYAARRALDPTSHISPTSKTRQRATQHQQQTPSDRVCQLLALHGLARPDHDVLDRLISLDLDEPIDELLAAAIDDGMTSLVAIATRIDRERRAEAHEAMADLRSTLGTSVEPLFCE